MESSLWRKYRESAGISGLDSSMNSSSKTNTSVSSRNTLKTIVLPGGIDTGKFLEEQLRRVRHTGVGKKKQFKALDFHNDQ